MGRPTEGRPYNCLQRRNESCQQSAASWNVVDNNMFVIRVGTVTINPEAIQNRDSHRRQKVSIGCSPDLRFSEFEPKCGRNCSSQTRRVQPLAESAPEEAD